MSEAVEAIAAILFLLLLLVLIIVPVMATVYFFGWELLGHFTWSGFLTGMTISIVYLYALGRLAGGEK